LFLHQVRIENFRGIRRLRLKLDHTTVLVGENSFGKSNLMAALDLALGPRARGGELKLLPSDVHVPFGAERPSGRPVLIGLIFRERSGGEWETSSLDPVRAAMTERSGGRLQLSLQITGRTFGGELHAEAAFLDSAKQPISDLDDELLLASLRRVSPVVHLGAGGFMPNDDGELDDEELGPSLHPDVRRMRFQIRHLFRKLMARETPPDRAELEAGLDAVREALGSRPELLVPKNALPLHRRDLVHTPLHLALDRRPKRALDHPLGSATSAIGPLVLLGAMLEAMGPAGLHPGARPLVVVEDAEAHLHPTVLASAWGVIEGIKAQRIVTTNSPELLAAVPLSSIRRLVRRRSHTEVHRLKRRSLSREQLRRVGYHVRMRRGGAFFARCWLLIEGETEAWLLPELARLVGLDFAVEGVHCIEFAQCGVAPLAKLANDLGIPWHLITDGDDAGASYARSAASLRGDAPLEDRVTRLESTDIERCLWDHGYDEVFRRQLPVTVSGKETTLPPHEVIARAVRSRRKPQLALDVIEAAGRRGSPGVPWPLREVIDTVVRLARAAVDWDAGRS